LAVDRSFTNANNEREADFINAVIWRKPAENFANFFGKGSLVGIEGRLQTRSYDDQNGNRRYVTKVVVDGFSFLESKADRQSRQQGQQEQQGNQYDTGTGFNPNGFEDYSDVSENDLPF
jgi:single-strand DNA-binding protein